MLQYLLILGTEPALLGVPCGRRRSQDPEAGSSGKRRRIEDVSFSRGLSCDGLEIKPRRCKAVADQSSFWPTTNHWRSKMLWTVPVHMLMSMKRRNWRRM